MELSLKLKVLLWEKKASKNEIETGVASWYGPNFHGKLTANGEIYDMDGMTAAHRTLPFGSEVVVENLDNGKKLVSVSMIGVLSQKIE